jgi:hypothetical protein
MLEGYRRSRSKKYNEITGTVTPPSHSDYHPIAGQTATAYAIQEIVENGIEAGSIFDTIRGDRTHDEIREASIKSYRELCYPPLQRLSEAFSGRDEESDSGTPAASFLPSLPGSPQVEAEQDSEGSTVIPAWLEKIQPNPNYVGKFERDSEGFNDEGSIRTSNANDDTVVPAPGSEECYLSGTEIL